MKNFSTNYTTYNKEIKKMKNIKVDFMTNTIITTKGFYEAAMQYGSEEYKMLQEIKKDNPKMKVSVRESNRKATANPYKGLTYRYMRKFISVMDNENLDTFERVILHFEGVYTENGEVYAAVRDWFLENYPHHKEMIVAAVPTRKTSLVSVPKAEVCEAAA